LVFIGVNMLKEGEDITSLPTGGRYQQQNQGQAKQATTQAVTHDPSFVPLGLPLLAGPGAISLVIVQSTPSHVGGIVLAILITMLVSFITLSIAGLFGEFISENLQRVITRIMGLVTVAFAVQYVFSGIDEWLGRSVSAYFFNGPLKC